MWTTGKILVVDDDAIVCRSCRELLAAEGHEVDEASTGREALRKVAEGDYDVVLLDLKIPDCSGLYLVRTVRKLSPHSEVIVITGYPSIENAKESIRLGAFDYVTKPFVPGTVLSVVAQALACKPWAMERWCSDGCFDQACVSGR